MSEMPCPARGCLNHVVKFLVAVKCSLEGGDLQGGEKRFVNLAKQDPGRARQST